MRSGALPPLIWYKNVSTFIWFSANNGTSYSIVFDLICNVHNLNRKRTLCCSNLLVYTKLRRFLQLHVIVYFFVSCRLTSIHQLITGGMSWWHQQVGSVIVNGWMLRTPCSCCTPVAPQASPKEFCTPPLDTCFGLQLRSSELGMDALDFVESGC